MDMPGIVEILKGHGIRPTRLRIRVLEVLMSTGKSYSFTEMYEHFGKKQDRVTIYRTFNLFCENRLIQKVVDIDGIVRFYYCESVAEIHPSFRCRECGLTTALSPLPDYYRAELGNHHVDNALLLFSGICERCRKRKTGWSGNIF